MTSVTATQTQHGPASPRDRLQAQLETEISSGSIRSADRTALETALDAIDEAMQANGSTSTTGTRTSPDEMHSKLQSLIDQQVKDGGLTSDQADELKQLFADAAPKGGPGGAGGPPPPPPQGETESSDSSSSSSSTDLASLLAEFLKQVQARTSSTTGYGTDGSSSTSAAKALVLDTSA